MTTPKRLLLIAILGLAVALVYALKQERPDADSTGSPVAASESPDDRPSTTAVAAARGPSEPTSKRVAVALPRLVDVGADKCIPCKAMAPILEELRQEYAGRLRVDFIDAWKYPEQAEPFNVYGIPAQIFFNPSGREIYRHVGFISKEEILATWQRLGFPLNQKKS